ncbi:hypothetical protein SANA_25680 [Gottschalkiaceae bacterium SANA]|nr:hypothetical protein SANA_25680 [Gottschalkiaceae bacterium SANA]
METIRINCSYALKGSAKAEVLYATDSFSFWGGVDVNDGVITDRRHSGFGKTMAGKVFMFPFGRGSSGAGTMIMEMARLGTAPAAMINIITDPVILTGPLIANSFYGVNIPVANVSEEDFKKLENAKVIEFFEGADYIEVTM